MIYLNWSFPTTPLTFKWSLVIPTVARTPSSISIQTQLANGVLTMATLGVVVKVFPYLVIPALATPPSPLQRFVFKYPPTHSNAWHWQSFCNTRGMRCVQNVKEYCNINAQIRGFIMYPRPVQTVRASCISARSIMRTATCVCCADLRSRAPSSPAGRQ